MSSNQNMSRSAILDVALTCNWSFGQGAASQDAGRLMELLEHIQHSGSIASAARDAGISYRNAWGMLARWEERFGRPLLISERGLGTRLTAFGKRLLDLDSRIRSALAPHLTAAAEEMAQAMSESVASPEDMVRIHASHDLALMLLPDLMAQRGHTVDLQFHGSLESLASFAEGRCEVAGFHCPDGPIGATLWQQYRPFLKSRQHVLLRLARRTQGMMVKAGNPKRLRSIRDLSRPKVRFLNRQSGAGTRLVLDWLLRENGVAAQEIAGYGNVELTHSAVAAMIASGHADVGLGVEAAARQFGLGFVPLLREDYFLVTRRNLLGQTAIETLAGVLGSDEFRRAVGSLPGYEAAGSGTQAILARLP